MRFVSQPAISIAVTSRFSSRVAICVRRLRFPSQAFAISIASRCDFHRKPLRFQSRAFAISIASVCVFLRITDLPNYFPPPTAISSQACILCRLRFVRSAFADCDLFAVHSYICNFMFEAIFSRIRFLSQRVLWRSRSWSLHLLVSTP